MKPRLVFLACLSFLIAAAVNALAVEKISVGPDDDVQALIEGAAEGTTFHFRPGVYRQIALEPKSGQRFIGQTGVIFTGARLLTEWRQEKGYWVHSGLPDPLPIWDERWGSEIAQAREDLFDNDQLIRRVGSLQDVTIDSWYFENNKIYTKRNPTGRRMEYGVVPFAFFGHAANIEIRNIRVEKYAPRTHQGAVFGVRGYGWKLYDIDAQWNHAAGAVIGTASRIYRGRYNNNGQLGIRASGEDILIEKADVAYNNYAGFKESWEAGGIKFSGEDVVIRNNHVRHNSGKGIWADVDSARVIIEQNWVYENTRAGITYEISLRGLIRNNFLLNNGSGARKVWLAGASILLSNARDTEVHDNTVVIHPEYGNGIAVIHKDRGDTRITVRNDIRDNTIIHLGEGGRSGAVANAQHHILRNGNTVFDGNTYILPSDSYEGWLFYENVPSYGAPTADPTVAGMERNGHFVYSTTPEAHVDPAILNRLLR